MMKLTAAIILIIAGMGLRFLAILQHKGGFSLAVDVPEKLVTDGIYKYIRHPAYLGSILFISGVSLISAEVGILFMAGVFFTSRAIAEERILNHCFKAYAEYQKKTGMFLPKLSKKEK